MLNEVVKSDPRNYEALNVLASIYEQTNRLPEAAPIRKKMQVLDPFNPKNDQALARDEGVTK